MLSLDDRRGNALSRRPRKCSLSTPVEESRTRSLDARRGIPRPAPSRSPAPQATVARQYAAPRVAAFVRKRLKLGRQRSDLPSPSKGGSLPALRSALFASVDRDLSGESTSQTVESSDLLRYLSEHSLTKQHQSALHW